MPDDRIRRLVRFTLHRPVTILMLLVATMLVGMIAATGVPLELLPAGFVSPNVSVNIPVPDANPVEVEEQVTKPTEEVLRQIPGLEEIQTTSSKDNARINITFAKGVDADEAFAQVRDLMEVAKLSWPDEVQEYFTFRFNLDSDLPILQFGILLDEWKDDTSFLVDEKVIKEIEAVDGVARVGAMGVVEDTVRIFVNREKARASGVSLFQIAQAIAADNKDAVGGKIEQGGRFFYLRSLGRFRDLDEIRNWPVRPGLPLSEVAEVTTVPALRDFVFRLNGKQAIWLQVNKESSANTVEVCRRLRKKLDEKITKDPRLLEDGWTWFRPEQRDFGYVIETSLSSLIRSALLGGLLAILPLFLFLRRVRMTLIITLAIPLSLIMALAWIYFDGGTLNILSMMGITIAVGMLVDNSIVVVESIYRRLQDDMPAHQAALEGTAEVALAVTLATLTTVAAFVPLIFMNASADAALFTKAIGLPVCYSVLASLVVALAFIPLGTIVLYRRGGSAADHSMLDRARDAIAGKTHPGIEPMSRLRAFLFVPFFPFHGLSTFLGRRLDALTRRHGRVLDFALDHRFHSLVAVALVCAGLQYASKDRIELNPFSEEASGFIRLDVELEANYTLKSANDVFHEIQGVVDTMKPEWGIAFYYLWFRHNGGSIIMSVDHHDVARTKEFIRTLKKRLPKIAGAKIRVGVERQNEEKSTIQLRVFGKDINRLAEIADDLKETLGDTEGVISVKGGIGRTNEEIVVAPNRERMQRLGVDPRVLMGTIQFGIRGQRLPDLHVGDRKMQMVIEYEESSEASAADLQGLGIFSRTGTVLPLSNLADIYFRRGYGSIVKTNGQLSCLLTVEPEAGQRDDALVAVKKLQEAYPLPPGYSFKETSSENLAKEQRELMFTGALAIVLVLLLMGVLFESVLLPQAVFLTIPFALLGAWWMLAFTKTSLDFVGMIGAIVLIGIVVNNGIVFLDSAHSLVRSGTARREALLFAARTRLRPILMTTATTVVGLVPMALAERSTSFVAYQALSRGVIGGLIVSTFATLLVVPIGYTLLDDLRRLSRRSIAWLTRRGRASRTVPNVQER